MDIADIYSEQPSELLDQMSRRLGDIASLNNTSPVDILESRILTPHEERTAEALSRFANERRRRPAE